MKKKLILLILLLLIISIGVTYAIFKWTSTNSDITFNIEGCYVTYKDGLNISGASFGPALSKDDTNNVISKEISMTPECTGVTANLTLKVDSIDDGLKEQSFIYELYDGTTKIANGNFAEATTAKVYNLLNTKNLTKDTTQKYTLYIYIDGNQDNPTTMGGQAFSFTLGASGEGALYKEPRQTASEYIITLANNTSGNSGSGVYKVHHDAQRISGGGKLPAITDYRYYGKNPNNFVQLPDMNKEDGTIGCTYNDEGVVSFGNCQKIYKVQFGDDKYYYADEWIEKMIIAQAGSCTYNNGACYYNGEKITRSGLMNKSVCESLTVLGSGINDAVAEYAVLSNVGTGMFVGKSNTGLYRIIGSLYDAYNDEYLLKLIKAIPINDGTRYLLAWNKPDLTSSNTSVENKWLESSLQNFLNNGIWWKGTSGSMYSANNKTTDFDFTGYGPSNTTKKMIATVKYYLTSYKDANITTNDAYRSERNGSINDSGGWLRNYNGQVALMYVSDYGYASGEECASNVNLSAYGTECEKKNWILTNRRNGEDSWTITYDYYDSTYAYSIGGGAGHGYIVNPQTVQPVFYLEANTYITSGTGTSTDPYILSAD